MNFWTNYAFALAIVGLVLAGLAVAGRVLKRAPSRSRAGGHIAVVESLMLSPRASLHVVKAGRRHLLIGSTDAGVHALAEMELEKE